MYGMSFLLRILLAHLFQGLAYEFKTTIPTHWMFEVSSCRHLRYTVTDLPVVPKSSPVRPIKQCHGVLDLTVLG